MLFSRSRTALMMCVLPGLLFGTEKGRVLSQYAQLPLSFEPNQGQSDQRVQFLARTGKYTLFLTEGEAVMLSGGADQSVVRLRLDRANGKAAVRGLDKLPGLSGYFVGKDTSKWI